MAPRPREDLEAMGVMDPVMEEVRSSACGNHLFETDIAARNFVRILVHHSRTHMITSYNVSIAPLSYVRSTTFASYLDLSPK